MKKLIFLALIIGLLGVWSPCRADLTEVLSFDDVSGTTVLSSYGGLTWNNFEVAAAEYFPVPSGYLNGWVSAPNAAFNMNGDPAFVQSSGTLFQFDGAYFTAAWYDGMTIELVGSLNGNILYDDTFTVDTEGPVFFQPPEYQDSINELDFFSYGGSNPGYNGYGYEFVMDNFTVTTGVPVPEPCTMLLLGCAILGLKFRPKRGRS
jgi:hypothetical protein